MIPDKVFDEFYNGASIDLIQFWNFDVLLVDVMGKDGKLFGRAWNFRG